jgi:hypothetical protein
MGAWRIRVKGERRKDVDVHLVAQAIVALGEQLRDEARKAAHQRGNHSDSRAANDPEESS